MTRLVFMGSPAFAVPSLKCLAESQYEIAAVYTQPDRVAGRGLNKTVCPVKKVAQDLNLPVIQPATLKAPGVVEQLAAFSPDVIVVAAYGQILPEAVLNIPRYGCINIHPSLLPRHRGASPVSAAILSGDAFTGVTIMKMDKGLDTGPILVQGMVPITPHDTTGTLTEKLAIISAAMIQDVLIRWVHGGLVPREQDGSQATYSCELKKEDGEINWKRPAVEIWRMVRAFQPWPGAFTRFQGKRLEILRSIPLSWPGNFPAGQVIETGVKDTSVGFGIVTGEGVLGICEVQLEGKKTMRAGEFRRGQRELIGAVLPS